MVEKSCGMGPCEMMKIVLAGHELKLLFPQSKKWPKIRLDSGAVKQVAHT